MGNRDKYDLRIYYQNKCLIICINKTKGVSLHSQYRDID